MPNIVLCDELKDSVISITAAKDVLVNNTESIKALYDELFSNWQCNSATCFLEQEFQISEKYNMYGDMLEQLIIKLNEFVDVMELIDRYTMSA